MHVSAMFRRHDVQIGSIILIMVVFFSRLSPGFLTLGNMADLLEN